MRRIGLQPSVITLSGGTYSGNPKGYDAVILNNVARARLAPAAQDSLIQYVNAGGSLVRQVKLNAAFNDYTHSEFPTAEDSTGVSDPQANHFHKQTFNGVLQFEQQRIGNVDGAFGLWVSPLISLGLPPHLGLKDTF